MESRAHQSPTPAGPFSADSLVVLYDEAGSGVRLASVMIVYCRSFIRDSLLCATERGTLPSPPGVGPMEHHLCLQRGGGNAIHKGSSQPHYLPSSSNCQAIHLAQSRSAMSS